MSTAAPLFRMRFLGRHDGGYAFRAPIWKTCRRGAYDAYAFEQPINTWLIKNVDPDDGWAGNGSAGHTPVLAGSFKTGNAYCVWLRRPSDVKRFAETFPVVGLTPDTFLGEIQLAEAA